MQMPTLLNRLLNSLFVCLLLIAWPVSAGQLVELVGELQLEELRLTFDNDKVDRILGEVAIADAEERRAAAVLVTLGLKPQDMLNRETVAQNVGRLLAARPSTTSTRLGVTGERSLYTNLTTIWDHDELLTADEFLDDLSVALSDGVITGYDLRPVGVYDEFPQGLTFIYSQSSLNHLRQLALLLHSEDLKVTVHGTAKVSAFLFRDDWGSPSDQVKELPGGIRVVNGREVAMLFEFETSEDLLRFHQVIERYAKKDDADEPGLIANAWWQPFYYTDVPYEGFNEIGLVVLSSDRFEATLTVLPEKIDSVLAAFDESPWKPRVDRVWVNPPFYRFLQGGYK